MYVDTHCHLNIMAKRKFETPLSKEDFSKINVILEASQENHVTKIITIATSLMETKNTLLISQKHENVFGAIGIHPCDGQENWKEEFTKIESMLSEKKIIALGETGLDFYHKPFFAQRQIDLFKKHIETAVQQSLPLVIHSRNAIDEVLKTIEPYKNEVTGVFHCFSESKEIAKTILNWNFFMGIGGPITYPKNESLRETVKEIPLEHLLLETDAPFLPPQGYRGKENHPKHIPLIAQKIAEIKRISIEKIAAQTTKNAEKLFRI
jgi:TatD DNase family protein